MLPRSTLAIVEHSQLLILHAFYATYLLLVVNFDKLKKTFFFIHQVDHAEN